MVNMDYNKYKKIKEKRKEKEKFGLSLSNEKEIWLRFKNRLMDKWVLIEGNKGMSILEEKVYLPDESELFELTIITNSCGITLVRTSKYGDIYMKCYEKYGEDNPLNTMHLIEGFLKDMELNEEFLEYCKMRYEMKEGGGGRE